MCITLGLLCLGWIHNETIPIEAKLVSELWAWRTWKLNSPHVKLSRPGAFLKFPWSHGWGNSTCEMYWVRLIKAVVSRSKRKHNLSTITWTIMDLQGFALVLQRSSTGRLDVSIRCFYVSSKILTILSGQFAVCCLGYCNNTYWNESV